MFTSHPVFLISTMFSFLLLVAVVKIYSLTREKKLLSQQLTDTTIKLEQIRRDYQAAMEKRQQLNTFNANLQDADLTTQLQKPRLKSHQKHNDASPPEKYSYIHSLTERGMSTEDIASLLSISPQECQQLVNLSKIARAS